MSVRNEFHHLPEEEKQHWTLEEYRTMRTMLDRSNHTDTVLLKALLRRKSEYSLRTQTILNAIDQSIISNGWDLDKVCMFRENLIDEFI